MRKSKLIALITMLIMAVLLMTSCTTYNNFKESFFGNKETSETIKIGVLQPQTGNDSSMGELEIRGIELAHKLVPQVLGKDIELVYADTQSSIYAAETAVEDLRDKRPAVVLGSYGDAVSLTASQILGEAEIPAIGVTISNPLITSNNPYYFRVAFTDASQGQALAKYVFEQMGLNQAAVVKMKNEDTAAEMISQFRNTMRKLTKDDNAVVTTIEIPEDEKDFSKYAEKLKALGIKAVFMPVSLKVAENMFQQAEELGMYDVTFVGPNDWHNDELIRMQGNHPGIRIAVASDLASDIVEADDLPQGLGKEFSELYKEQYGSGEPPEAVVLAFDAYMIAVEAIANAGSAEGVAVQQALLLTKDFAGASGKISFNESGEPKKTININVIRDGKFVSVFAVN